MVKRSSTKICWVKLPDPLVVGKRTGTYAVPPSLDQGSHSKTQAVWLSLSTQTVPCSTFSRYMHLVIILSKLWVSKPHLSAEINTTATNFIYMIIYVHIIGTQKQKHHWPMVDNNIIAQLHSQWKMVPKRLLNPRDEHSFAQSAPQCGTAVFTMMWCCPHEKWPGCRCALIGNTA